MSTPEGKVKDKIKKYLKEQRVWVYWPVQMGMGVAGVPDCVGCYRGRHFQADRGLFFGVEVKAPGKKMDLRPAQEVQIGAIRNAHGKVFITDNADEFIAEFTAWMDAVEKS